MTKYIKGLSIAIGVSILAFFLAKFILIGSVAIAIILGIVIGNVVKFDESYNTGITYAEKTLLGYSIALMGINLDFNI